MCCKYLKNTVIYSVAFKAPAFSWNLGPLAALGRSWREVEWGDHRKVVLPLWAVWPGCFMALELDFPL